MASPARVRENLTLEEFLRLPEEEPSLEYIDGRIEVKVSPRLRHAMLTARLTQRLDEFAGPRRLGVAVPELRCTFASRSIVPDVAFLLREHVPFDANGRLEDEVHRPPDLHVEIISPGQSIKTPREKLVHATANGSPLGWLIHPDQEWIEVFRPREPLERLAADAVLDGGPVLPGFRLPVAEVFGWLRWNDPA